MKYHHDFSVGKLNEYAVYDAKTTADAFVKLAADPRAWRTPEPVARMRHMERKALVQFLDATPDGERTTEERLADIEKRFAENRTRKVPRVAAKEVTGRAFQLFQAQKKGRKARKKVALLEQLSKTEDADAKAKIVAQYNSYIVPRSVAINYYGQAEYRSSVNEDGITIHERDNSIRNMVKRDRRARRSK